MHQTKKGNQWYFGMKAHFGVDSRTKLIHAVVAAPANVADSTVLPDLLQADQHHRLAAPVVGYRREREAADAQHEGRADGDPADVGLCQMQRLLGQHQQRAGDRQIVPLDKADQGEHGDDQDVVAAERDVVERPSRRSRTR